LSASDARFLIVGAYAVSFHSQPRATGDLDVWVDPSPENAHRVFQSLAKFGAPMQNLNEGDLRRPGTIFQIGVPPRRIDLITSISGVEFSEAWPKRVRGRFGDAECHFIGREALIRNKRAVGRPRDLADLELLGEKV